MNKEKKSNRTEFDIFDILLSLATHKLLIFIITFIVSVSTIIYVLVIPEKWSASTTFKTVSENDSTLGLGSSFMGLGANLFGSGSTNAIDHLVTLNSQHFRNHIIEKFHFAEYFNISEPDSLVRKEMVYELFVSGVMFVNINDESQLITIKILTEDKNFSAEIANYCRDYLDKYTKEHKLTKSKEKRIFIENRTLALRDSIDFLAKQTKEFLENNKLTQLEKQTEELISIYSELYRDKVSLESEIVVQNKFFTEGSQNTEMLKEKLSFLNSKIEQIETNNPNSDTFTFDEVPELMYQFVKLESQLKVYIKAYEFLYPQLEVARIEEIEDSASIEVVDIATPKGMRSEPKRSKICILMFIAAFLFSSFIAVYLDTITDAQKDKFRLIIRTFLSMKNA